jgi:membrane protein YdbS with pleckstrin-like domain
MDPLPSKTESNRSSEEDRRVVWEGRPAWSEYIFLWFFALVSAIRALLIFFLPMGDPGSGVIYALGVGLFIGLALFFQRTNRYVITRAAVHRAAGFLGRGEKIIPLKKIAAATVEQGPLDRLFGIGNVVLRFKEGERNETMRGVRDPEVVCTKIEALL